MCNVKKWQHLIKTLLQRFLCFLAFVLSSLVNFFVQSMTCAPILQVWLFIDVFRTWEWTNEGKCFCIFLNNAVNRYESNGIKVWMWNKYIFRGCRILTLDSFTFIIGSTSYNSIIINPLIVWLVTSLYFCLYYY